MMLSQKKWLPVLALGALCGYAAHVQAGEGDIDQRLDKQQQEIDALKSQLDAAVAALESGGGHGTSGKTTVGGYGELHYNNLDSKKEMDFHRFVLFFGHRFSDTVRFNSELELEHSIAGEGQAGEVELEQAYVDFDIAENHRARAGLFLVPVGILNETHEPPTFYGVERNPVESNIIPTTWWEGGAGLSGTVADGLSYDVAVTSGLNVPVSGSNAYKVRSGRQKVAEAVAEDLAYTARLRWSAVPGVEVAGSIQYQSDVTQGAESVSATLLEAHAVVTRGAFGLRALYAAWDLDGEGARATGRNEQSGWYVEPSWKVLPQLGVFARYNEWDNEAGSADDSLKKQVNMGINYWPHENVVIKADLQQQSGAVNDDGFNLGVGYQF